MKKRKMLWALLPIFLILLSCNDTVSVNVQNLSDDPYDVFVDGKELGSMGPHEKITVSTTPGMHTFKVVQIKGYLFVPTEKEATVNFENFGSYNYFFP